MLQFIIECGKNYSIEWVLRKQLYRNAGSEIQIQKPSRKRSVYKILLSLLNSSVFCAEELYTLLLRFPIIHSIVVKSSKDSEKSVYVIIKI